jgi:deoxyribodipyrimidine photo-lyase
LLLLGFDLDLLDDKEDTMQRILVYLLRRDLRVADNPILHEVSRLNSQSQKPFTHLLPVYIFPANQIEVSGLIPSGSGEKSPYDEARSSVAKFWRCGKLRAQFTAESVWDVKTDLEKLSSGLTVRAGTVKDVVQSILDGYRESKAAEVHGLWMTEEEGWEEKVEEQEVKELLSRESVGFKLWPDEKYFIDDRDVPFKDVKDLSDVFTTYRKQVEPLRSAPRKELPAPKSLPPLPDFVPEQKAPFAIPGSLESIIAALHKPLDSGEQLANLPRFPEGAKSAQPLNAVVTTHLVFAFAIPLSVVAQLRFAVFEVDQLPMDLSGSYATKSQPSGEFGTKVKPKKSVPSVLVRGHGSCLNEMCNSIMTGF